MRQYSIYMATIDYMIQVRASFGMRGHRRVTDGERIQAYGPYAASATGGNGFARDFLAGIAALYSMPRKPSLLFSLSPLS